MTLSSDDLQAIRERYALLSMLGGSPDIDALLAHIDDLTEQLEIARGERFGTDPAALGQAFAADERIVALEEENKELRREIANGITRWGEEDQG